MQICVYVAVGTVRKQTLKGLEEAEGDPGKDPNTMETWHQMFGWDGGVVFMLLTLAQKNMKDEVEV